MTLPYAVIIAGGAGERLGGVRKADLRVGGQRQLDRVMASIGSVAGPVLVATGPQARNLVLPSSCRTVADIEGPCAGPLAGLIAAVADLAESGITSGLLVSVAVDTPFLPADYVARLGAHLESAAAAFAGWGDDFYPPNALWQLEALQSLPDELANGTFAGSLKALQRRLGAVRVDWAELSDTNPFANINTLADLLALQRLALKRD